MIISMLINQHLLAQAAESYCCCLPGWVSSGQHCLPVPVSRSRSKQAQLLCYRPECLVTPPETHHPRQGYPVFILIIVCTEPMSWVNYKSHQNLNLDLKLYRLS